MKKISLTALFMLLCFIQIKAIEIEGLFAKYKQAQNADNVKISYPLMKIASMFISANDKDADIVRSINSVHVISLNACSDLTKHQFTEDAGRLKTNKYEVLVNINNSNEQTRILAKQKDKQIKELIIIQTGKESLLLRITGTIDPRKYMSYANQYTQKKE